MIDLTVYAIPAFVALMLVEAVVSSRDGRPGAYSDRRDTLASLAMGLGSVFINLFWKGAAFALYSVLHRFAVLDIGAGALAWAALIVCEDFCYYWYHRASHEIRFLWAAHVNHHSSRRYNLSTALRQSWTTNPAGLIFWAPLPLIGFDPMMILTAQAASLLYQFWIHTEKIGSLGPLEWVLNTPSHHRVHHGTNVQYLDRNHAGIFIVWDRLLGTFEPEVEPVVYGLTKNIESHNPLHIAFHEWAALLGDVTKAASWSDRLGYLVQPPGWSPDGNVETSEALREAQAAGGGAGLAG